MFAPLWLVGAALAGPATLGLDDLDEVAERLEDSLGPVTRVGPADPDAIVNGSVVPDGNDQVVALGGLDAATGQAIVFCSGSLIHDTWVLTAAHCIDGSRDIQNYGLQLHVLWGSDANTGYTRAIPWASSVKDPSYNPSQFVNDAGLVELAEPRDDVQWMVLNDEPLDASWIGTELQFYGYGVTQDFGSGEGVQRTTRIPISEVDGFNIMTFSADTNVCSGDSGGPSTWDGPDGPEQVGVNAFVTPGCNGGSAGSTRVDNHIEWIRGYVPEVATSYADLPVEEVADGGGGGRHWLDDMGIGDELGIASAEPGTAGTGCDTTGAGTTASALLGLVRRRP